MTPARSPRPHATVGSPASTEQCHEGRRFNILDFLDRAEPVYGDRIGVIDEPDQPADSRGQLTWRQVDINQT